ncbi:FLYWCH-type domain-containing protein [Aphis craccivora]|uniref:FLYWCH-type domain-containing protein n=1 Tax=Aphis craccivora TaxID=307492 RepID=A0A6G0YGX6_APHCR|nr:FLYWCH-type domain-containing protein [Aphis craccivora]
METILIQTYVLPMSLSTLRISNLIEYCNLFDYRQVALRQVTVMSAKIISNKRDNPQIIINNFEFQKAYERYLQKKNVCTEILNTENKQNHEVVNENTINRPIVNTSCKRKAPEDVSTRPKKIILQELIHNERAKEITINDINRIIKKNMYENRRKILPANP